MAINKTIFTADRAAQKGEIFSWLTQNASGYFDEITQDASGNIVCSLDNGAEFTFMFDATAVVYNVKSKTGNSHSIYSGTAATAYTKSGIVTSYGIMLISTATSTSYNVIIISKTNTESVSISAFAKSMSGSAGLPCHYFIDLDNDTDWLGKSNNLMTYSVPVTSFAPVCFSYGTYCEHAFFALFTQFENPCIIQMNGKKYAYGGYLALEE